MKFRREQVGKLLRPHRFQHQAHDQVLGERERRREAFRKVCFYVIDNSRVAGLVAHPRDWRFAGAVVPGYADLHPLEEDFWPLFWKLYLAARAPDAGNIIRPPLFSPGSPTERD